jgi:hypothetical protein
MCSTGQAAGETTGERLARLDRAIEDLAADSAGRPHAAAAAQVADRLAGIWAMLAELDPELARRLAGYYATPD